MRLLGGFLAACLTTVLVAVITAALPVPPSLAKRQTWTGAYSHDFSVLGCKPIIFIYARETLAAGNMVSAAAVLLAWRAFLGVLLPTPPVLASLVAQSLLEPTT